MVCHFCQVICLLKRCRLSYATSKSSQSQSMEVPSLLAPRDHYAMGILSLTISRKAPLLCICICQKWGLQESCLMNVRTVKEKRSGWGGCQLRVYLLASDINSRSQILFSDSRNDRNMIFTLFKDQSGGKKLVEQSGTHQFYLTITTGHPIPIKSIILIAAECHMEPSLFFHKSNAISCATCSIRTFIQPFCSQNHSGSG